MKIGKFMVFVIHSFGSAILDSSMPLENSKQISTFTPLYNLPEKFDRQLLLTDTKKIVNYGSRLLS